VIGAVGNVVLARALIRAADRAFGAAPAQWPDATPSTALTQAPEQQPVGSAVDGRPSPGRKP